MDYHGHVKLDRAAERSIESNVTATHAGPTTPGRSNGNLEQSGRASRRRLPFGGDATPLAMTSPPQAVSSESPSTSPRKRKPLPAPLDISPPPNRVRARSSSSASESDLVSPYAAGPSRIEHVHHEEADRAHPAPYYLSKSQPPPATSNASSYSPSRPINGLGLGVPFSASTSSALNSMLGPGSPRRAVPTASTNSSPRLPSSHTSSIQGSPVLDRNQLVGLGELATPRWNHGTRTHYWPSPGDPADFMSSPQGPTSFSMAQSISSGRPGLQQQESFASSSNFSDGLGSGSDSAAVTSLSQQSLSSLTRDMPDSMYSLDALSSNDGNLPTSESGSLVPPTSDLFTSKANDPRHVSTSDRRASGTSQPSSRRSSMGKEAKQTRPSSSRRHSAGRNSFAHLPPSPAVPSSATLWAADPMAPPLPEPSSASSSTLQTPAKNATDSNSKNMRRSSSYQSSPSAIAANILRHTREFERPDVDFVQIAAKDSGTAEALRKLDGLSSPRASRSLSGPSSGTPRSRANSRSASDANGGAARTPRESAADATSKADALQPPSPARAVRDPFLSPSKSAAGAVPRSPLLVNLQHATPSSTVDERTSANVVRTSSSSTNAGASYSTTDSRQSFSGSSFATSAPRSASSKQRRSSTSSDVSSTHSKDDTIAWAESATASLSVPADIPPVPPIPKDWEAQPFVSNTSQHSSSAGPSTSSSSPTTVSSQDNAKTKTKSSRKWSLSNALSKATRSPRLSGGLKESTSFNALSRANMAENEQAQLGTSLSARKFPNSTNNLASLASSRTPVSRVDRKPPSTAGSQRGQRAPLTNSKGPDDRPENKSDTGSLSVSRSRTSLLSTKKSSSNIPFFSRKSSSASVQSSASSSVGTESDDKSGRRSIIGLNFLRSSASKKDRSLPPSPNLPKSASSIVRDDSSEDALLDDIDELGRRIEALPTSASALSRPRGKTIGASNNLTESQVKPVHLPPHHVSDLSLATRQKVAALEQARLNSDLSAESTTLPLKVTNRLRREDSQLPTIDGSPGPEKLSVSDEHRYFSDVGPSVTPPPISRTPTRIPRLNQNSTRGMLVPSPASTPQPSATQPTQSASIATSLSSRRVNRLHSSETLSKSTGALTSTMDRSLPGGAEVENARGSLAGRQRVDSEASGIPRTKTVKTGFETATQLSRSGSGLPRSTRAEPAKPHVVPASSIKARVPSFAQTQTSESRSSSRSTLTTSKRATVGPEKTDRRIPSNGATNTSSLTSKSGGATRIARTIPRKPVLGSSTTDSRRSSSEQPAPVDEDQTRGDAEMAAFVRRQQTKKLAAGSSAEDARDMFHFPEPIDPVPPLTPSDAALLYSRALSDYEKEEIMQHAQVYFVGQKAKKNMARKEKPANNFGYDDDRGDYLIVPHDHIMYRYEVIDVLGKGSFGQVLQCRDHKTGEMVAVKIIRNKKRFHHQALVEVKVLENLVKWDPDETHYVIRMNDSFTFRSHLCIVTELLSINLYELVKANNFAGFTTTLIRRFTTQILASLCLLRHHRVVHCDLKPENILLKHPSKSFVKVIDFGSSCFEHEKVYTYIQSRFYRSPEVILGMNYHMAIDMWSLGCIIAEMYTGYPIFPGENEQEQLACIMEVMGLPDKYLIDRASRRRLFFDSTGAPRPVVNSKGRRRRPNAKTLQQVLRTDDDLFVDFIAKCLIWDPEKRLKPEAALRHPWIKSANSRIVAQLNQARNASREGSRSNSSSNLTSSASGTPRIHHAASSTPVQVNEASHRSAVPRLASNASLGLSSSTRYVVKSQI